MKLQTNELKVTCCKEYHFNNKTLKIIYKARSNDSDGLSYIDYFIDDKIYRSICKWRGYIGNTYYRYIKINNKTRALEKVIRMQNNIFEKTDFYIKDENGLSKKISKAEYYLYLIEEIDK